MLEPLFGSKNRERALLVIYARNEAYATEIARFFDADLFGIQSQLDRMEAGGILASRKAGRTRLYRLNPRYPFLGELRALLGKTLDFLSSEEIERLFMNRRRPRRRGKPL